MTCSAAACVWSANAPNCTVTSTPPAAKPTCCRFPLMAKKELLRLSVSTHNGSVAFSPDGEEAAGFFVNAANDCVGFT